MALSIKPHFSQSLNNLGVVYTVQVCFLVNVLSMSSSTILSYLTMYKNIVFNDIFVSYVQGKMDAAAAMIEKAIAANPTYSEAYNNLGE